MKKVLKGALAACMLGGTPAAAAEYTSLVVTFNESAPKDSFIVRNTGNCHVKPMQLKIDLALSQGRLIFDTTASGAGVEVFQPFEITRGRAMVDQQPNVRDGDDQLDIQFTRFPPKSFFAFTIDVDDTAVKSASGPTRVTGPEIEGATVSVRLRDKLSVIQATFSPKATAVLRGVPCS